MYAKLIQANATVYLSVITINGAISISSILGIQTLSITYWNKMDEESTNDNVCTTWVSTNMLT